LFQRLLIRQAILRVPRFRFLQNSDLCGVRKLVGDESKPRANPSIKFSYWAMFDDWFVCPLNVKFESMASQSPPPVSRKNFSGVCKDYRHWDQWIFGQRRNEIGNFDLKCFNPLAVFGTPVPAELILKPS
jgi:hypothetical protein